MKGCGYSTTPEIQKLIAKIGRTEDAKFSSDGRYLAIVEYLDNKIHLFEIDITGSSNSQVVNLINATTIRSVHLNLPHGFPFLGDGYFLVANRGGDVTLFKLPIKCFEQDEVVLMPVSIIKGGRFYGKISSPGSIDCYQVSENRYRLLVCNNDLHSIVSFEIDISDRIRIKNKGVLIKRGLNLPDGISISQNKKWIAVSNHNTGTVLIYRLSLFLNRYTAPSAELTDIAYPHGLRFSTEGQMIFVADAGSQYLHIFECNDNNWNKNHKPRQSVKLVENVIFAKGRVNPQEGGIKGVDIANQNKLLVTTAHHHVLDFYAISTLLAIPVNIKEQVIVKEKMQYYRKLIKTIAPAPEI